VSVAEASEALGISVEAVRGRIKRDTLEHEKADDGTVYVLLKPDQSRPAPDQSANQSTDQAMTMARLENEVQFLREELARKDAILLNMTEAMKALSPPREDAPESPESPAPSDPLPTPAKARRRPQSGRGGGSGADPETVRRTN
jgi:hypothetical protein